jgi:hypothetical protein
MRKTVMDKGSGFIAAITAVLLLQLIEPSRVSSPFWHDALAALVGVSVA